jgi:GNAT superfamily N-acetyltransferase
MVVYYTSRLASETLESDARYFELGARSKALPGASLSWVPGLTTLPAGCVVQRVQPETVRRDPPAWIRRVEREVLAAGTRLVRIYLDEAAGLDAALAAEGYQGKREIAFLGKARMFPENPVRLREVLTEADWREKERIHRESPLGPDGHQSDAAKWTRLLRLKNAAGGKRSFLCECDDGVCGTVGALEMKDLVRLKNIVIRPAFRGQGLGLGVVRCLIQMAAERGKEAMGVFAVEGAPGERLYTRAGMTGAAAIWEWTKQF